MNMTDRPIALDLGLQINGGQKQVDLRLLSFDVIDERGRDSRYSVPLAGVISGRVDPFVILLIPHAEVSFPLAVSQIVPMSPGYCALPSGPITIKPEMIGTSPDRSSLQMDMQRIVNMPFWTGTAHSNSLKFQARQCAESLVRLQKRATDLKDLVCGFVPDEGFWMCVVVLDEAVDGGFQFFGGVMDAAPEPVIGDGLLIAQGLENGVWSGRWLLRSGKTRRVGFGEEAGDVNWK
jgi:hypothetical protein